MLFGIIGLVGMTAFAVDRWFQRREEKRRDKRGGVDD